MFVQRLHGIHQASPSGHGMLIIAAVGEIDPSDKGVFQVRRTELVVRARNMGLWPMA